MADKPTKKAPTEKAEKTLQEQLAEVRQDLLDAQKTHRSGELVNPKVIARYRKQIARLMTKLNATKNVKEEGK